MKIVVHFSTIQPRFADLSHVIMSWLEQSVPVYKIVITTSCLDPRFVSTDLIGNVLGDLDNDKIIIQLLDDVDFGPHNKMIGALKFYETLSDRDNVHLLICDDDNKYDVDTVKTYLETIERQQHTENTLTQYKADMRLSPTIAHVQGADTYLLNPLLLSTTTYTEYLEFIKNIIAECPDAVYQDDYVVSFFIQVIKKIQIKTVARRVSYNMMVKHSQMHLHIKVHEREKNTLDFLCQKLSDVK